MAPLEAYIRPEPSVMLSREDGAFKYYSASGLDRYAVPHAFTTRAGGVSEGYLAALNMGVSRGDSAENLRENYRIVCNSLGLMSENTVFFKQTHSDKVRKVTAADAGFGLFRDSEESFDALVTNEPEIALCVFSADCVPILLYDPVNAAVGAVHAGWRGTAGAAVSKALGLMKKEYGTKPENVQAAIGAAIGPCCFETDDDVPYALTEAMGLAAHIRMSRAGKNRWRVDLKNLNRDWLINDGVPDVNIAVSHQCTACLPDVYWSHRGMKAERGAQCAVVSLPGRSE